MGVFSFQFSVAELDHPAETKKYFRRRLSMQTDEIRSRIKKVIYNLTKIPAHEIADTASYIDDLDLDSLAVLEFMIDVEKEFGFKIPENEVPDIRSVEDTVRLVERHFSSALV
jgi:acyl carrier protein